MNQSDIKQEIIRNINVLLGRSDRIEAHWQASSPRDWEELAQFQENDEVVNALDERTRQQLLASKQALERMETAEWTRCTRCDSTIQSARLEALPLTTLCVQCAKMDQFT